MKNVLWLMAVMIIAGCANLGSMLSSSGSSSAADSSVRGKMQACMLTEAQSRFQAGTLFNDTITNTAQNLVSTCAKKLALESVGINQQSQSDATNIINSLKNLSNN
ncbi:MAG: hypothetical protein IJ099_00095 [Alphaproteobacteria bacterium]|nr:hypothetical protein [Alphaproteobacteria bacterium]